MEKVINEKFVKQAVIKWLFRNGWGRNLEIGETRDRGVDIKVRHNKYSRYFLIETKGQGKIRQADEVAFVYSLGQIITRMKTSDSTRYYYGLGLPLSSNCTNRSSANSLAISKETSSFCIFC